MFNFNVWHVLDKRYTAINKLFRRSRVFSKNINEVYKKNIDNSIDDQLNCRRIYSMRINKNDDKQLLKNKYSEKFQKIAHYLITLTRPNHSNRKKFRKFKDWALQFLVRDRHCHEVNSMLSILFLLFLYWTNVLFKSFIYTSAFIAFKS